MKEVVVHGWAIRMVFRNDRVFESSSSDDTFIAAWMATFKLAKEYGDKWWQFRWFSVQRLHENKMVHIDVSP